MTASEASTALREALTEAGSIEALLASPALLSKALEAVQALGEEAEAKASQVSGGD